MRLIDRPGALIGMKYPRLSAIVQDLLARSAQRESINLAVGELILEESQLYKEWTDLTSSTFLAGTKLNIRAVPAEQQCMWCFFVYRPAGGGTTCPQCGSVGAKILHGEEFYLEEK